MEQHNPCQRSLASSWTNLPFFVKPIDGTRDLLDLDYLARKDAFYIPPQPCQQELVSSYIDWVHPFFPFLDNDCLEGICRGSESPFRSLADGQISLLLWQAMMFAATAFVNESCLHEMGFDGRLAARRAFYMRARLLYDLQMEKDHLQVLQATLLLTHWVEDPSDSRGGLFWLNTVKSLLQTIDVPSMLKSTTASAKKVKLWRRTWWSCFVRNTMLTLSFRRPSSVEHIGLPLSLVALSDFDVAHSQPAPQVERDGHVPAIQQRRTQAASFVQLAELCVCSNRAIDLVSTANILTRASSPASSHSLATFMGNYMKEMEGCEQQLKKWSLSYNPHDLSEGHSNASPSKPTISSHVYHIVMQLTFLSAAAALYRPLVYPGPEEHSQLSRLPERMRFDYLLKLRAIAREMAALAEVIVAKGIGQWLPSWVTFPFVLAGVVHLLHARSDSPDYTQAEYDLHQCRTVLVMLAKRFDHARHMLPHLDISSHRQAAADFNKAAPERRVGADAPTSSVPFDLPSLPGRGPLTTSMNAFPKPVRDDRMDESVLHPFSPVMTFSRSPDVGPQLMTGVAPVTDQADLHLGTEPVLTLSENVNDPPVMEFMLDSDTAQRPFDSMRNLLETFQNNEAPSSFWQELGDGYLDEPDLWFPM